MHYFEMKKKKIFWGGGIAGGEGTAPPQTHLPPRL